MHLAARAGHFHVVDRLTGAKAHLEAKGGEYSGGTPEAWKARKARKVDQILFVFGPKRVGPNMEATKRRVTGVPFAQNI